MWWAPSTQMLKASHSVRSLLPQCLNWNSSISHISYMLWKHRKYESSFSAGKLRERVPSTGRSGHEAGEGASLWGNSKQSRPALTLLILQPTPRAIRQANPHHRGSIDPCQGVTAPVTHSFFMPLLSQVTVSGLVHSVEGDGFGNTMNWRKI